MNSKLLMLMVSSVALVLAGCSTTPEVSETPQTQSPSAVDQTPEQPTTAMETDDSMMVDDAMMEADREITVDMFAFGYSMEEISVEPGETIKVNLTNSGGNHDFDVDELGVDGEVIAEGETTSVMLEIPEDAESGTEYAYYCSVGNHRAQGMEGTIIVE